MYKHFRKYFFKTIFGVYQFFINMIEFGYLLPIYNKYGFFFLHKIIIEFYFIFYLNKEKGHSKAYGVLWTVYKTSNLIVLHISNNIPASQCIIIYIERYCNDSYFNLISER